jgi:hypothetical protein
MASIEDEFLSRLARGGYIAQDEYDQMAQDLPPELVAQALAARCQSANDAPLLAEAARLYFRAGKYYEMLEVCSRAPQGAALRRMAQKALPYLRRDYPGERRVGKLLEQAFLVIDLETGQIERFPPLMPAT